jgi:hypothetical protein
MVVRGGGGCMQTEEQLRMMMLMTRMCLEPQSVHRM